MPKNIRVRVNDNYPDEWVRGATGTVLRYNHGDYTVVRLDADTEAYKLTGLGEFLFTPDELDTIDNA